MAKSDVNLIDPAQRLRDAPRCRATAKGTGKRCAAPAVRGWRVCRVHGAAGGHKAGPTHPRYRHGMRSREWVETRKAISELVRMEREVERLTV